MTNSKINILTAGYEFSCGSTDFLLSCWGKSPTIPTIVKSGVIGLTAGSSHLCAIKPQKFNVINHDHIDQRNIIINDNDQTNPYI